MVPSIVLALAAFACSQPAAESAFPLRASDNGRYLVSRAGDNGRYLVSRAGASFFVHADTG